MQVNILKYVHVSSPYDIQKSLVVLSAPFFMDELSQGRGAGTRVQFLRLIFKASIQ